MRLKLLVVEIVALLVVLAFVVVWIVRGSNFEPVVTGVAAVVALGLEWFRRREGGQAESSREADRRTYEEAREAARQAAAEASAKAARERPRKLTDEATLAMWLKMDEMASADKLSTRAAQCFRDPVLIDGDVASAALTAASAAAESAPSDGVAARVTREEISKAIPSHEAYLEGLRDLGDGVASGQLRAGYRRAMQADELLLAWIHLLWLEELGERDTLMPPLKELLLALARHRYRGDRSTVPLGEAVFEMAKRVQGINFPFWWNREILPVLQEENPPGIEPRRE